MTAAKRRRRIGPREQILIRSLGNDDRLRELSETEKLLVDSYARERGLHSNLFPETVSNVRNNRRRK